MLRLVAQVLVSASLTVAAASVFADEEHGPLGFSVEIVLEGFFSPTVKSATIVSVVAASPAASAGITAKDQVVEVDGHSIVGAKARDLEPIRKKPPGQPLRLKLQRPSGEEYSVTLELPPQSVQP
jgi:C-terminal processing protease CtpA/Prc